jgi:hypothetical protein
MMTESTAGPRSRAMSEPGTDRERPVAGRRPPVGPAAVELLHTAGRDLIEATATTVPTERYAAAHLAALRTAAAVLAVRTRPVATGRPRNVWALLPEVAPELTEWAAFFAAGAGKRAAAEAGLTRAVLPREADDLLRDAQTFLALVETTLGLAHQAAIPHLAPLAQSRPTTRAS